MRLNFETKNKKVNLEADGERLIEKSIDNYEKNWKEKFNVKYIAKKDLISIKHNQKIELEKFKKTKKNWIQKIQEEQRKTKELKLTEQRRLKELELEEKKRQETQENKRLIILLIISSILGLLGICFFVAGSIDDPALNIVGMFLFASIAYMWHYKIKQEEEKQKNLKRKKFF